MRVAGWSIGQPRATNQSVDVTTQVFSPSPPSVLSCPRQLVPSYFSQPKQPRPDEVFLARATELMQNPRLGLAWSGPAVLP